MMIHRGEYLSLVAAVTLALVLSGTGQLAHAQGATAYEDLLSGITRGRMVNSGRVSIVSDNIVKEDEPLLVMIDITPIGTAKDERVELHLLMSEGPWPKAYTAVLSTHDGYAHFATRIRVKESCVLHAIAEIDGKELFDALQGVKVSAAAYVH